jgi:hypothetical protein
MTEKRREEIAAPAIVARMTALSRDSTLSDVCGDIRVRSDSIGSVFRLALASTAGKSRENSGVLLRSWTADCTNQSADVEHSNPDQQHAAVC